MNWRTFDRRRFLRGAGGVTMGLPFLETLAQAEEEPPKRFIIFTAGGGSVLEFHYPNPITSDTPDGFTFGQGGILSPLEPYKKNMVVLSTLDNVAAGYDGHFENEN